MVEIARAMQTLAPRVAQSILKQEEFIYSTFDVGCSIFDIHYSTFDIRFLDSFFP